MTPEEALRFLAQCGIDLTQYIPPSARQPVADKVSAAVAVLKELLPDGSHKD